VAGSQLRFVTYFHSTLCSEQSLDGATLPPAALFSLLSPSSLLLDSAFLMSPPQHLAVLAQTLDGGVWGLVSYWLLQQPIAAKSAAEANTSVFSHSSGGPRPRGQGVGSSFWRPLPFLGSGLGPHITLTPASIRHPISVSYLPCHYPEPNYNNLPYLKSLT